MLPLFYYNSSMGITILVDSSGNPASERTRFAFSAREKQINIFRDEIFKNFANFSKENFSLNFLLVLFM